MSQTSESESRSAARTELPLVRAPVSRLENMKNRIIPTCLVLTASALVTGQFSAIAGEGGTAGGSTDCATAPAASIGDNAFSTSGSTVNLALTASGNGGYGCAQHTIYKANYFTFTPSATGSYTMTTCGTRWDTRIAVLNACSSAPPMSAVVACNDDACGYQSSLKVTLNANVTYRIVVGGFGPSDAGTGVISIRQNGSGSGPDVIVGLLSDIYPWGAINVNGVAVAGYSIGTDSCNIGSAQLEWFSNSNRHPFIPQNMYRFKGGRLEQIGMSWGKHGFTALQQGICGTCISSGTGTYLGIGCSDPYSASLNGSQTGLGCRSEVNAATGVFTWPHSVGMPSATSSSINRRVQVARQALDPALNAGAVYLAEAQYIAQDDARAGNDDNNCSWRVFTVGGLLGTGNAQYYDLDFPASSYTQRGQPAIHAWKAFDPTVRLANVDVPSDGRLTVAHAVRDNGNGTWRYEYAIQNINSHRSANSFSVPVPPGVTVSNAGFKDIDYHSGEPYSPTDWTVSVADGRITWTGADFATAPNGNALRFATLYNFWFDASAAPVDATASIGLFRPGAAGTPNQMATTLRSPRAPTTNPADLNDDGMVNGVDLGLLLSNWGGTGVGDINQSGQVSGDDLGILLTSWS